MFMCVCGLQMMVAWMEEHADEGMCEGVMWVVVKKVLVECVEGMEKKV